MYIINEAYSWFTDQKFLDWTTGKMRYPAVNSSKKYLILWSGTYSNITYCILYATIISHHCWLLTIMSHYRWLLNQSRHHAGSPSFRDNITPLISHGHITWSPQHYSVLSDYPIKRNCREQVSPITADSSELFILLTPNNPRDAIMLFQGHWIRWSLLTTFAARRGRWPGSRIKWIQWNTRTKGGVQLHDAIVCMLSVFGNPCNVIFSLRRGSSFFCGGFF